MVHNFIRNIYYAQKISVNINMKFSMYENINKFQNGKTANLGTS